MRITRATVEQYAKEKGLEPIQIDGIPEGFSWVKKNEREIQGLYDYGHYMFFKPNAEWTEDLKFMYHLPVLRFGD